MYSFWLFEYTDEAIQLHTIIHPSCAYFIAKLPPAVAASALCGGRPSLTNLFDLIALPRLTRQFLLDKYHHVNSP